MTDLFNPEATTAEHDHTKDLFGERGHGKIYVYDEKTVFAVQVAQTTGRPLLLRGAAGSGKSSLAPFVANVLNEPFYPFTVTARTQARDMMWTFDALARLNDANVSAADPKAKARVGLINNYLTPGPLWWAFDREQAQARGGDVNALASDVGAAKDPAEGIPGKGAVVLIDEIDKADPDVPNNLLEALGSRQFPVLDIPNTIVKNKQRPLVIITTNEERELPRAFLRRCIVLHLEAKKVPELVTIATEHFGERAHDTLYEDLANVLDEQRKKAEDSGLRPPSTAEFLDAIAACRALEVAPLDPVRAAEVDAESADRIKGRWRYLIEVALAKRQLDDETSPPPEPIGADKGEQPSGADQ